MPTTASSRVCKPAAGLLTTTDTLANKEQRIGRHLLSFFILLLSLSVNAQTIIVQQYNSTTGWANTLTSAQTVSFPTAAAAPSKLTFIIRNNSATPFTLTGNPIVVKAGTNASDFAITQPSVSQLAAGTSTTFEITYNPTTAGVHTAQLSIANTTAINPFIINLKGASFDLYGPQYPPIGTIGSATNGEAGRAGGRNLMINGVSLGTLTTTYWGPQVNTNGELQLKVSLDNSSYTGQETLIYVPGESNLAAGKAVWRGNTLIQNAISNSTASVLIRATLTTKRTDNSIVPMVDPASLGLSEQVGGLISFSTLSDYLVANYFIEASSNNGASWQPYLDFYDAYPTPPGPLPGVGIGNAYSSISSGFYWVNMGPKLSANNILNVNEGASAVISTAKLNATDSEDLPANPQNIVFSFSSTGPLVFGTGVLKKNGVPMNANSTFTLQDLQNNAITFEHDGSETVYDEFQFRFKDSKGKAGADGPNTVFSFKINIAPVNDPPVTRDTAFSVSFAPIPITKNLVATDADIPPAQLTYSIVVQPTKGTINLNSATGQFTYTSTFGAPTTDFFTFRASDGTAFSNTSTVTINQVNLPPTVSNQDKVTMEDVAVSGTLTGTDPEGTAVSFAQTKAPAKGSVTVGSNGAFTYTPAASKFGADYFTFKATDAQGTQSIEDTIFIRIIPRLDPGDVLVVDKDRVRLFDPATSQDTVLTKGQGLTSGINIAYRKGSSLFIFDKATGLIKADPVTGVQSLVAGRNSFSSGGPIEGAPGMLLNNAGKLIVTDGNILQVDTATGVVTTLFSGGLLKYPTGVVYLNNGDLIVSDAGMIAGGTSRIIRITPAGVQSVVSTGGIITLPLDLAIIDQNTVVISDAGSFAGATDNVYKINLTTGAITLVATGGSIAIPSGIDFRQNKLYVVNGQGTKKVLDINPSTGAQTALAGSALTEPWGLMVVKEEMTITAQTKTDETCAGAANGTDTITFTGGVAPYKYTVDGGTAVNNITSPVTITGLSAASHSIIITDALGSFATASIVINAGNPLPAAVATPATQTICSGDAISTVAFSSSVNSTTYTWTRNNATAVTGIATTGSGNISGNLTNATTTAATTTFTITPSANGCAGPAITASIVVNLVPTVNAVVDQTVCNSGNMAVVNFSGGFSGTVYQWASSNPSIGLASSGTGPIPSFVAVNNTSAPVTATITITPTYANNNVVCSGAPKSFTITVNPTPTVDAVSNQIVCNGGAVTAINFTGATNGTVYNWTNSNSSIGLPIAGSGNIGSFNATNNGTTPVTATFTVTPSYTNGGVTCTGTTKTFTITVNPTASVNAISSQVVCNGATVNAVNFTGTVAGTVYNWTNSNPSIGLAASGTGNISSFTAVNNGSVIETATITVTPVYTNGTVTCTGSTQTFTIAVNPTPSIAAVSNATYCADAAVPAISFAGPITSTTYSWTSSINIGFGTSGTGPIPAFTAVNNTGAAITTTITVTPSANNCSGTPISFTISINAKPAIITQPAAQVVCPGSAATFSVGASGTGLTYQWLKGGSPVNGATSATYTVNTVTPSDVANYSVIVSGTCAPPVTSNAVALTLSAPPSITTQPVSQLACAGSTVSLLVNATGINPTYQWLKGTTPIAGATNSSYTIANFSAAAAGTYSVIVTNSCGTVTSSGAIVGLAGANSWVGNADTNWNNVQNWCGGIPTATTDVTIPSGSVFKPLISADATARNITISSGAQLTVNASGTLNLYGDLTTTGTFNAVAGKILFAGSTNQSIPEVTVAKAVMNGSGGITLSGNLTVTTALDMINGNISLGNNNVVMTGGTGGSTTSHIIVNGTGAVTNTTIGSTTALFPIGPTATSYNPVWIANGGGRNFSVKVATGINPAIVNPARAINRTWTITPSGTSPASAFITFQYADADANASAVPGANMEVGAHNGSTWSVVSPFVGIPPTGTPTARQVKVATIFFGNMVLANTGSVLLTTAIPNIDMDVTNSMLLPNVVKDQTVLRLVVRRSMKTSWTITDATGKVVMRFNKNIFAGATDIPLRLGHLAAGIYHLNGFTEKGAIKTLRIIRP